VVEPAAPTPGVSYLSEHHAVFASTRACGVTPTYHLILSGSSLNALALKQTYANHMLLEHSDLRSGRCLHISPIQQPDLTDIFLLFWSSALGRTYRLHMPPRSTHPSHLAGPYRPT
jgi:hypothetical protein